MERRRASMIRMLLLACFLVLVFGVTVHADGWVRNKNKVSYRTGKTKATGMVEIGGRTYFFDSSGVQRMSWRKVGEDYYCFRSEDMSGGYMMTNTTWNGIWLGADGKAELTTPRAVRKAAVMVRVSALLDRILDSSKKRLPKRIDKMKACFDYLRKHYPYRFVAYYREKDPNYDLFSVEALLNRGYADCHPYSCTFAYLASALGCPRVTVCIYYRAKPRRDGHSWVLIGNKVYDVSHARFDKSSYELFGMNVKRFSKIYYYYPVTYRKYLWEP